MGETQTLCCALVGLWRWGSVEGAAPPAHFRIARASKINGLAHIAYNTPLRGRFSRPALVWGDEILSGKNGGKWGLGPVFWETELGDLCGLLDGWVQGWVG